MEKSFFVNLGSRVFQIDESAYTMLDTYITNIRQHYAAQDPDGEIVEDFEYRLSDILWEKSQGLDALVTVEMTKEAITQLGPLEAVIAEESMSGGFSTNNAEAAQTGRQTVLPERKLYRHPTDRWIAGVLSGLSIYFNIDPIFLRLLFVLLLFTPLNWTLVILYIAFWIFLPVAITVQQRLEMEGRPISSQELWEKITEEADSTIRKGEKSFHSLLDKSKQKTRPTFTAHTSDKPIDDKKNSKRRTVIYWIVGILAVVAVVFSLIWAIYGLSNGLFFNHFYWGTPYWDSLRVSTPGFLAIPLTIALSFFLLILGFGLIFLVVVLPVGLIIKSSASPLVKGVAIVVWLIVLSLLLI